MATATYLFILASQPIKLYLKNAAEWMQDDVHCHFLLHQHLGAHAGEPGACLAQAAKREDGSRADAAAQGAGKAAAGAKKSAPEPKAKAQAPAGEASSAAAVRGHIRRITHSIPSGFEVWLRRIRACHCLNPWRSSSPAGKVPG